MISIGYAGRFFPDNFRPLQGELAFARQAGFECLQFMGKPDGLGKDHLRISLDEAGKQFADSGLISVMEIIIRVSLAGEIVAGQSVQAFLEANLSAIRALKCVCVHVHLAPVVGMLDFDVFAFEESLVNDFRACVEVAQAEGFAFGFEHNEPDQRIHGSPKQCDHLLQTVEGLNFVWDVNHTMPDQLQAYSDLLPRTQMLHVSDTPLPEVNYHLPLGEGNINWVQVGEILKASGFRGPAILEVGGIPKSGGFGRDTDAALVKSLAIWKQVLGA